MPGWTFTAKTRSHEGREERRKAL